MSNQQKFGQSVIKDAKGKDIYAQTHGQLELLKAIDAHDILFVNGPAGTGKTFMAVCKAVSALDNPNNRCKRIVLTRPAVESGEELGFLPGSLDEKIGPYMKPLYDSIEKLKKKPKKSVPKNDDQNQRGAKRRRKSDQVDTDTSANELNEWMKNIEIAPLAYMRGSTFDDSFIILDEAQNTTSGQMKLLLTRLGKGSKVVITGDVTQTDLNNRVQSGFRHAQRLLSDVKGVGFVTLDERDIVRHKLVKDIILKYEKEDSYRNKVYSNKGPEPLFEDGHYDTKYSDYIECSETQSDDITTSNGVESNYDT